MSVIFTLQAPDDKSAFRKKCLHGTKARMNALIIDGYVDEPACFGVPPYISPYVRYAAGVLFAHGYAVTYRTCDIWRRTPEEERKELLGSSEIAFIVMGLTVPGRYRGGSPLTLRELEAIARSPRGGKLILAGPVHAGYTLRGGTRAVKILPEGVDFLATGDPEASLDIFLKRGEWQSGARRNYGQLDEIAPLGAEIVRQHPLYPDVIAELELSRGCDRVDGRCSFCTEGAGAVYEERGAAGVASEVRALAASGIRAFRLGRCANILAWGGERTDKGMRPNPARMEALYAGIRAAAPGLSVLHTDNCNPLTLANFPDESRGCLEAIVRYNTEGDGLSLGIECMDPGVRSLNGLKVSMEEAISAVRIINETGFVRKTPDALPSLLPGLNFIVGLAGDSKESLAWNENFLRRLLDKNLAVRRINIRRAMVFPGSGLETLLAETPSRVKEREYRRWKEWVRAEVDPVMLARVAPDGTLLRGVIAEERSGNLLFGRQLGSYPPLVGIASPDREVGEKFDVMVTDRGSRSLTGVVHPLDINTCSRVELSALPGIGKARAERLIERRPYGSPEEIKKSLEALDAPGIGEKLIGYFRRTDSSPRA